MSFEEEKKVITTIRQCQRNWDLSKEIPSEHIEHWIYIAKNSPSKQDEGYYNVRVITNKELIQYLSKHTWGKTVKMPNVPYQVVARNSQMAASVYILFTEKHSITPREIDISGKTILSNNYVKLRNVAIAAGMAGALVAQSAAAMGYKTGFNTNHSEPAVWHKTLRIPFPQETLLFGIGIGFPQEGRARNETDEREFYVGGYPSQDGLETGLPNCPGGTDGVYHTLDDPAIIINGKEYPMPDSIDFRILSDCEKQISVWKYE
jgi:hypothetical protein